MSWYRPLAATIALSLLAATPSLAADVERSTAERIWYAQGLTHPIVVHLPIALLLAAAVAVVLRVVFRRIGLGIVYYCLLVGALGAIPSTLAGWAWAPMKASEYAQIWNTDSDIFLHRWGGVVATALSVFVAIWATVRLRAKARYEARVLDAGTGTADAPVGSFRPLPARAPSQFGWQFSTVLLALLMGWVGHEGGEQVYPGNFDKIIKMATGEEPIRLKGEKPIKTVLASVPAAGTDATANSANGSATQPAGVAATPVAAAGKIDFEKQVWPIFTEKCIYCHGPEKDKGNLRMDTEAFSLKGGDDDGPLYTPGNAKESPLILRAVTDDEDMVMPPPKEKKALTSDEIKILTQWLDEGAVWNMPATAAPAP